MHGIEVGIVIAGLPLTALLIYFVVAWHRADARANRNYEAGWANFATAGELIREAPDWLWPAFPSRVTTFIETGRWSDVRKYTITCEVKFDTTDFHRRLQKLADAMASLAEIGWTR